MKRNIRTRACVNIIAIACCSLLGCSGSQESASSGPRIGMMPKLIGIGYFEATREGAEEAARELGIELTYDGPHLDRSEDQAQQVSEWTTLGFDVIAVAPVDPEGISEALRDAQRAGVTTLTWDTDANADKSGRSVFVNQAPNEAIGYKLVDVMAEGIQAKGESLAGNYLIVSGSATASNQNTWIEFMKQRIAEKYPEMKLLPHLTPNEDRQRAQEQTAEALAAHAELKGIWGITSVSLPAVAKATRDAKRAAQVYVTGLSLPSEMREYVKDGTVEQFVLWNPVYLGYMTIQVANRSHAGNLKNGPQAMGRLTNVEVRTGEVILGPPMIFTRDNIDDHRF